MWNQLIIDPSLDNEKKNHLSKNLEELKTDCNNYFTKKNKQVRNLIEFNDGLFVWNQSKETLCYVVIRNDYEVYGFQTMLLSNPPMNEIFSIKLSGKNNKYLLLSGQKSVVVVELPRKYGNQFFYEGSKEVISVKSWFLLERLFVCNDKIKLLESHWHPGSFTEQHVVLLTNDNFLRFVNIFESSLATEEIRLSSSSESFSDHYFSAFASSLGETAVSFDFGSPTTKTNMISKKIEESDNKPLKVQLNDVYWPIFILKGSGDVLLIYSNLLNSYISKKIYGPLKMLPYAEDNYGVDGCSLIVINSNPSLIVIATSKGLLHHCIVLENDDENKNPLLPEYILHVYETIELTLNLTSSKQIDNNFDIMLLKNQSKNDRYFCIHMAGVHIINIPFIHQLSLENEIDLEETIVEHLICTKPLATLNQEDHIVPSGLSLVFRKGFLLTVLLSSGEIISQKLSSISFLKKDLSLLKNDLFNQDKDFNLKIKPIDFHEKIQKLLQRESNTPLIKSKQVSEKFEYKDGLQFILNTTETLKKEYLAKFDSVSELIDKRVNSLVKEKDLQKNSLNKLMKDKNELSARIDNLSSKYDKTLLKQEALSTKVEIILDKLMKKQTSLTEAEVKLMKTIESYQEKIENYKTTMNQINLKYKYQEKTDCSKIIDENLKNNNKLVTAKDLSSIQKVLKQQSEDISFLVNKINYIQQNAVLKNL